SSTTGWAQRSPASGWASRRPATRSSATRPPPPRCSTGSPSSSTLASRRCGAWPAGSSPRRSRSWAWPPPSSTSPSASRPPASRSTSPSTGSARCRPRSGRPSTPSPPRPSATCSATPVEEAVAAADAHEPDVVLMDLHLGTSSGVDATREIVRRHPGIGVLVVTMLDDDDSVFASMRAGARGYLLKGADPTEVERAVRAVANGEILLGPAVAERAVAFLAGTRVHGLPPFPELTDREREVLD